MEEVDQLQKLSLPSGCAGRQIIWLNGTVQEALKLRTLVGRNGYEYLRQCNYLLPPYRTLCAKLEKAPFETGLQNDILQWITHKMAGKTAAHTACVMFVDEMQIKPHVENSHILEIHQTPYVLFAAAVKTVRC